MASASRSGGPEVPFVGRRQELSVLREGLERARAGEGRTWVLRGPGGIGKTWLMREVERTAVRELGFEPRWAYAMQGLPTPFFLLEQLFRHAPSSEEEGSREGEFPTLLFVEEDHPVRIFTQTSSSHLSRPLLLTRESPSSLRERFPDLLGRARALWLTRSEGEGRLPPSDLERIAESVGQHLKGAGKEGVVVVTGLEYLATQNSFLPALRLVQHLRDQAEESGGHVLVALRPGTLEPRERALLVSEGESWTSPSSSPRAAEDPTTSPTQRMLHYLEQLERASRGRPQLLLMDDLQWVDPLSLQALGLILRLVPRLPVLVVASLRDEGGPARGEEGGLTLPDVIEPLARTGAVRTLELEGLSQEEVGELCRSLAPEDAARVDGAEVGRLRARTEGNPFFLREMMLELARTGRATSADEEGPRASSDGTRSLLPSSIRRLVGQRLTHLSESELRLLRTAAIAGSTFEEEALVGALGEEEGEKVPESLDRLCREHRLIDRDAARRTEWTFSHPFVWEVVSEGTPVQDRQKLALSLARWEETHRPQDVETVARLFHAAGEGDPGISWTRKACERARKLQAGAAMAEYVQWTLDLLGKGPERLEERGREELLLVDALGYAGRHEASLQVARGVLEEFRSGKIYWEARIKELAVLIEVRPPEAERCLERLLRELGPVWASLPRVLRAEALLEASNHHMLKGDAEEGASYARACLDLLGEDGPVPTRLLALDHLAWSLAKMGKYIEALELFREGDLLGASSGELALRAYHLNGEGAVLQALGELTRARGPLDDAATLSRGVGDLVNAAIHLLGAAHLRIQLGELAEARARASEALRLSGALDLYRPLSGSHRLLGLLDLYAGGLASAKVHFTKARETSQAAGAEDRVKILDLLLALVRGEEGDPSGALDRLPAESADARELLLRVRARLQSLSGRRQEAVETLRQAIAVVEDPARALDPSAVSGSELRVLLGRLLMDEGKKEEGARLETEGTEGLRALGRMDHAWVPWV